ncbi:CobW family GTP-binding protein [Salinicola endophyticus]|uniref:CobW family GTP-binding protein n=1 Tax=Salinicola endophyticus TaxID=1949083 RepID=A0AB74U465_9GAMM
MTDTNGVPGTIAVTLIAGYLGAGKTTWLNAHLRQGCGADTLVLVNDFGTLNVDAELIEHQGQHLLALSSGCLCCSLSDELGVQLSRLARWEQPPTSLIIETSGVARPGRIADLIRVARRYHLERIVTLVDLSTLTARLDDRRVGDLVAEQIIGATELVVNRAALLSPTSRQAAWQRLSALAPATTPIVCQSDAPSLYATVENGREPAPAFRAAVTGTGSTTAPGPAPGSSLDWQRFSITLPATLHRETLEALLSVHQHALARAKGFIDCAGRRYVFQWSGGRSSWTPTAPGRGGPSQLIGIGFRGVALAQLIAALEELA